MSMSVRWFQQALLSQPQATIGDFDGPVALLGQVRRGEVLPMRVTRWRSLPYVIDHVMRNDGSGLKIDFEDGSKGNFNDFIII